MFLYKIEKSLKKKKKAYVYEQVSQYSTSSSLTVTVEIFADLGR